MATDIRLEEREVVVEGETFTVQGFYFQLDAAGYRQGTGPRRALMHGAGDRLILNPHRDYPGGLAVHGKLSAADDISVPTGKLRLPSGTSGIKLAALSEGEQEFILVGQALAAMKEQLEHLAETVEALQLRATIRAEAPHYTQEGWRYCHRCSNLTFGPNHARSVCPAGGVHSVEPSGNYTLFPHKSRCGGQRGWAWCRKCQGLSHGSQPLSGHCPAGGAHDRTGSPGYQVWTANLPPDQGPLIPQDFPGQAGWRWCNRCYGLCFEGNAGVCPAPGGGAHNFGGSYNYTVQHA